MKPARYPWAAPALALAAALTGCAAGGDRGANTRAEESFERGYADVHGLKMYYELRGSGGTPLVLLHGGGSTIETSFGKVLRPLAAGRRVIAFEQQGHGRTADVDRAFTFEQSAEDAVELLRHLRVDRADFYGYSNGGMIAMYVALRHPEKVRRLVLVSAIAGRDGLDEAVWRSLQDAPPESMPAVLREAYLRVAPNPQDLPVMARKCADRMLAFQGIPPLQLASIQAPTLILVGDHSDVRPEHAVSMLRTMPRAQLGVLPGANHLSIVDRDDLLMPMVLPFLDAPSGVAP